jgi:exoribonuclease R
MMKQFHDDVFDGDGNLIACPTRKCSNITGVLDLRRTYGKEKKKFIYVCRPDDKRLPMFYVPYDIPYSFDKTPMSLYVMVQFKHWEKEYPLGTLVQNFGPVDDPVNFYEYMVYAKRLNASNQLLAKEAKDGVVLMGDVPLRKGVRVVTIDSSETVDFDDAFSFDDEKVSVYITHVPYVLDKLNLWGVLTDRVSTLYLPDKRRTMLPTNVTQHCSLTAGQQRVCFVVDFYHDGKIDCSMCRVRVNANLYYDKPTAEYEDIVAKHGDDVVARYMVKFNQHCASVIREGGGIYTTIMKPPPPSALLPAYYRHYATYTRTGDYLQMSSPIRRLVDVLNMYKLSEELGMYVFSQAAKDFHASWYNRLDDLNSSMRNTRHVQNKCKLLEIFSIHHHQEHEGYVFEPRAHSLGGFKHNVYLPSLKASTSFVHPSELAEGLHWFTIYVFHDDASLKKKIKLKLTTPTLATTDESVGSFLE